MNTPLPSTFRIGEDVAWTSGPGRVVALDLVGLDATPQALEGTAVAVWTEIAESPGITLDGLLARLTATFDATEDQIRGDVEGLLRSLASRNLIVSD